MLLEPRMNLRWQIVLHEVRKEADEVCAAGLGHVAAVYLTPQCHNCQIAEIESFDSANEILAILAITAIVAIH